MNKLGMRIVLLASLALLATRGARAQRPYDFELFPLGLMFSEAQQGQDGWRLYPGSGAVNNRQYDIVTAAGRDGKVLQAQLNSYAAISRRHDARYAFHAFQGQDTDASMMMDVRFSAVTTGNHAAVLALGHDGPDADEVLSRTDETGPTFGIRCVYLGVSPVIPVGFYIRGAAFSANATQVPVTPEYAVTGDWLRLLMRMNLAEGTGSLFYKNLTRGDEEFLPIPGLQAVPLELSRLAEGNGPTTWDSIYILLAEVGSSVAFQMDNVVPHVRGREPHILATEFDAKAEGGPMLKVRCGVLPAGKTWCLQMRSLQAGVEAWEEAARFEGNDEYKTVEVPLKGRANAPGVFRIVEVDQITQP